MAAIHPAATHVMHTLIYAKNAKSGTYTGVTKMIPKTKPFNVEEFLLANALPGPRSVILILQ